MLLTNGQFTVKAYALLDCGADSTLIREDIAKRLQLKGHSTSLNIQNAFLNSSKIKSKIVDFNISS